MRFSPPEDPVDLYTSGFPDDDPFNRAKLGKRLSEVVERIEDPLVIVLDGRWGTGKSWFLKRWVGAHCTQNKGRALTVYFDAFANDYLSDPLIALVATLGERVPKSATGQLETVKKAAMRLIKPALRIGLAAATAGASEIAGAIGDAALGTAKGEAEKRIEKLWEREEGRRSAMEDFRSAVERLTQTGGDGRPTPLVIVIDELDRCRPDYALEILEVIKHFFAVPNVHFVLGVNLSALENSVRARYGAETDASAYLRKFISFSMTFPELLASRDHARAVRDYADRLGKAMALPGGVLSEILGQLEVLHASLEFSLRDVERILSAAALLPEEAANGETVHRAIAITLLITRAVSSPHFSRLLNGSMSRDDLEGFFGENSRFLKADRKIPDDDRQLAYRTRHLFTIWTIVLFNEDVPGQPLSQEIRRRLIDYDTTEFASIPRKVYDRWLSAFSMSLTERVEARQ